MWGLSKNWIENIKLLAAQVNTQMQFCHALNGWSKIWQTMWNTVVNSSTRQRSEFFSVPFYSWHILRKHALEISEPAITKMLSSAVPKKIQQHQEFKQNIAEWVLISMSKNKQHVKAIDADFSKKNRWQLCGLRLWMTCRLKARHWNQLWFAQRLSEVPASGRRSCRHWHFSTHLQAATRCHCQTVRRSLLGRHGRHIQKLQTPCAHWVRCLLTVIETLERFVVLMYARTSELQGVHAVRHYLFSKKSREIENIPPTAAALLEHTKRAAFQAGYILVQCLIPKPSVPSPGDWGWEKWDGQWRVVWTTLPDAAKACYELISCTCKKICKGNCKCQTCSALHCTLAMNSVMETELAARSNSNSGLHYMLNYMYTGRLC